MAQDFIFEYFCRPAITQGVQGYNIVNTATYAIILFVLAAYVIYPALKKANVKFGYRFMLSLLPFVVFGSAFRVLNDIGIFAKTCNPLEFGFYTFTPGIWLLTAAIAIGALYISKWASMGDEGKFYLYFASIGAVFAIPVLVYEFTVFRAWDGFAAVAAAAIALTLVAKFITAMKFKHLFRDKMNLIVVAGQALDGSATYVATQFFRCGEQHPLSEAILGASPALFVAVKIIIALMIVYTVDHDIEDENLRGFIKVAIAILGFAPGLRDMITIGAGTCL